MRLLILGGAGRQAKSIVTDLLEIDPGDVSEITLAGRYSESLKARIEEFGSPKVNSEIVNVEDHDLLVELMKKHDLVMNAANTPTVYPAVKASLDAEVNIMVSIP